MHENERRVGWVRWCAWASFVVALPTTIWRVLPGLGVSMGTPAAWRDFQQVPGPGTWYVLGLSIAQLVAAACCLLLGNDVRRFVPTWVTEGLRRAAPTIVGIAGLLGAAVLVVLISMSIIAWENVDPFAGEDYDGWAWLSLSCYLVTATWPMFLVPAAIGHLAQSRARRESPAVTA